MKNPELAPYSVIKKTVFPLTSGTRKGCLLPPLPLSRRASNTHGRGPGAGVGASRLHGEASLHSYPSLPPSPADACSQRGPKLRGSPFISPISHYIRRRLSPGHRCDRGPAPTRGGAPAHRSPLGCAVRRGEGAFHSSWHTPWWFPTPPPTRRPPLPWEMLPTLFCRRRNRSHKHSRHPRATKGRA